MSGSIRNRSILRTSMSVFVVAVAAATAAWRPADAASGGPESFSRADAEAAGITSTSVDLDPSDDTSSPAAGMAEIDVTLSTEGQVEAGAEMLLITVTNPGTEALEWVMVNPLFDMFWETIQGPDFSHGADDDLVLEPGEQWLYRCLAHFPGYSRVEVAALTATGLEVRDSDIWEVHTDQPVRVRLTPSRLSVQGGDLVEWAVEMTNVTDGPLPYQFASGTLWAGYTATYSGAPISESAPMTLVQRGDDGDDVWGPDETWQWSLQSAVTVDGTFLMAYLQLANPDGTARGFNFASREISVEPGSAPTSAPVSTQPAATTQPLEPPPTGPIASELPPTGGTTGAVPLAAVFIVLVGATTAMVARRGQPRSHRS